MAVTNNLNLWYSNITTPSAGDNIDSSSTFNNNGYKKAGFVLGDSISSKTFNTILRELTLCNKAFYNVLTILNPEATITLGTEAALGDASSGMTKFVKDALTKIVVNQAANLTGTTAGSIPYQSASGVTSFTPAGTSGQLLQSNGANSPSWVNPNTLSVASALAATSADYAGYIRENGATDKTGYIPVGVFDGAHDRTEAYLTDPDSITVGKAKNIAGGAAGKMPIQSAADTTTFINPANDANHDYVLTGTKKGSGETYNQIGWKKKVNIINTGAFNQFSSAAYYYKSIDLEGDYGYTLAELDDALVTIELVQTDPNTGHDLYRDSKTISFKNLQAIGLYHPTSEPQNVLITGETGQMFYYLNSWCNLWIGLNNGTLDTQSPTKGTDLIIVINSIQWDDMYATVTIK